MRYVFPMKVLPWSSLAVEGGGEVTTNSKMKAVGFIPVYEDIIALVEDHGNQINSGTFVTEEDTNTAKECQ